MRVLILQLWIAQIFLVCEAYPEAEKCQTEESRCPGRVIVVGAGLAGLAAAQSLQHAQCDVVVLEAHQHVGGRAAPIHHGPFQGFQQGAQWIHGGEQNLVMMALLRFYNISTVRVGGNSEFEGDDDKHHLHNDGIDGALKTKAFRSFEEAKVLFQDQAARMVGHSRDASVRDGWASILAPRPRWEVELFEWQLRVRSEQSWAVGPERAGLRLAEMATYNEFDATVPLDGGDLSGGFSQLLEKMSEGLDIHLGEEVRSIHVDETEVFVQTANQTVYKGAAIIVTASLALLQARRIEFHPRLARPWYETLDRLQMGHLAKIFVRFLPGLCPVGEDTYLLSKVVATNSTKLLYYCIRQMEAETAILICLVGGPSAEAAHHTSAKGLLHNHVVEELREMYPSMPPTAVEQVYFASFADDPFVLGSWTSGKVGSSSTDFEIFVPKNGRLFFAGEHTCRLMYGTAQAAVVSGARAAQQVIRPRDPPLSEFSTWPLFDETLSSLCDELAPFNRQEVCTDSCDKIWQRLAYQVPSYFQNWSGIPRSTKTCWEGLGWTEHCWLGHGRPPPSSRKQWKKLNFQEQKHASCVGYDKELWNALRGDTPDLVICRSGSRHFRLPWDCLHSEMKKDWMELGLTRSMLDEGVPSPLTDTRFGDLSAAQQSAALRIGRFGTCLATLTTARLSFSPRLPSTPTGPGGVSEVASKTLAAAWAKLEARQHAWKEEQEAREIRLLEKEEDHGSDGDRASYDWCLVVLELGHLNEVWKRYVGPRSSNHDAMPKAKSRSPPRKPQKSNSLPQLKKTYYAPLQLCSVNLSKHTYSCKDVRLGVVERGEQRRLPFMHVDRADDRSETVPKLPSLSKIMNSIHRMKLTEPKESTKAQSMQSLQSLQSPKSGSLRLNPLFGGSPPYRGGPRLPVKRKRYMPGTLAKVKLPRSRPSSGKKGKRAAWAKESETEFVEYNEDDSHEEEAQSSPKSEDESGSSSSSSDSSSGSSWSDSSDDEHEPPPPSAMRGRSTAMTRRMSAFAMMLPLLDSNNQPVRRASVAEAFLKAFDESKVEDNKPGNELDFPWSDEECRSVFIKFDTDTDGEVATEDLEIMLRYMGCILRKGEVEKLIQDMFSYATVSWEALQHNA
eukprot:s2518_g4.t2